MAAAEAEAVEGPLPADHPGPQGAARGRTTRLLPTARLLPTHLSFFRRWPGLWETDTPAAV